MKKFDFIFPLLSIVKSWLTNLSVAAMAVGLFQESATGLLAGGVFLIIAFAVAIFDWRYNK